MSNAQDYNQMEESFEVEAVTGHKIIKDATYYYIKWKGYTDIDNTWEREEDLTCKDLIKEYMEKQKIKDDKKDKACSKCENIPNPPFK